MMYNSGITNKKDYYYMSKKQEVVDSIFQQSGPFYSTTIASLSGASPALISNTINSLLSEGKITSQREGKKLIYALTDGANNTQMTVTTEPICSVAERFDHIRNLVDMVIKGIQPSVVITGQPGIGKSFIVREQLKAAGLKFDTDYLQVNGHSSPFSLYKLLHDHRESTIVFDDSDSVFDYPISVNILKAALDSYDRRWVSWYSSVAEQQDLDPSFEFTGKIIFISNRFIERIDPAIRSRAFCFNLKMTNSEISEHMGNIVKDIETGIHINLRREALDYLKTIQDQFTNYSLRVLIQAIRIRAYCAGTDKDWKQMIKVLACNV